MKTLGRVYLVGAGPGDPDLLTVKALRLISEADVVVFDRLVSNEVLGLIKPGANMIAVGKAPKAHPIPQQEINAILIREASHGRRVVRLKGGDPFIFGRGSEEALALRAAGIPYEVVPGITAAQGCAAATGVPLTHRALASGVRYITGHCRNDQPLEFDWQGLADPATTLVVYMGAANMRQIARNLINAGLPGTTPVLAVSNATTAQERRLVSRLDRVGDEMATARLGNPVLFVIGRVVELFEDAVVPFALTGLAAKNDVELAVNA